MAAIARVIADEAADLTIASLSHAEICKTIAPCTGCRYYCGDVSGGRLFVCAVHPHGIQGDSCPDYEAGDVAKSPAIGGFTPATSEENQYFEAMVELEEITGIRADECDRRFRRFAARYPMHWVECYRRLRRQIMQRVVLLESPYWECNDTWLYLQNQWLRFGRKDPLNPNPFNQIPNYQ